MAHKKKFRLIVPDDDFDYEYLTEDAQEDDESVSCPPTISKYNADDDFDDDFWF